MAVLEFRNLKLQSSKAGIAVSLYEGFCLELPAAELERIGQYKVVRKGVSFPGLGQEEAERKFLFLVNSNLASLKTRLTSNSATYIHRNLGLPLVGNISFGIVDRGSSLLEIKPVTSCMLDCIYCSISEGKRSCMHDFVVEWEYMAEEVEKVAAYKGMPIECHINCQGEPLLYSELQALISGLKAIRLVRKVSFNTNGVLLTKDKLDGFISAGLDQLNVSINALDQEMAARLAGGPYPTAHVKAMLEYCAKKGLALVIAPVLVPGFNEAEVPKLIKYAKRLGATLAIQNFLEYKRGRRPARQRSWEAFDTLLEGWETEFGLKLRFRPEDFNISPAKELPKPWKVGDVLKGRILCPGRYKDEAIVALQNRSITVITQKLAGEVKFKLLRTKHNIYLGKAL
jgi:uncharacterized protein